MWARTPSTPAIGILPGMSLELAKLIPGLLGLFFFLLGSAFVRMGVRGRGVSREFERVAQRAQGEVTDIRYERVGPPGDSSSHRIPVLRFTLPDGRVVETEGRMGTSAVTVRTGQRVTVLYDPEQPTRARVEGQFGGGAALAHGCGASIGALFAVVGLLLMAATLALLLV